MPKIRGVGGVFGRDGKYEVCTALPDGGWDIVSAPTLDDALRLAGMEPDETLEVECGEDEDCDLSELFEGLE